jgi:hypothetical protein
MTRDDIIRLRDQADEWAERHLCCTGEYHPDFSVVRDERFAALVAAAEREACAKVCDAHVDIWIIPAGPKECAAAIRARGQE